MPETTLAADKRDIFRVGKTEPACLHSHCFLWFLGLSCVAPSPTLFFDFPKPFRFETLSLRGRSEKVNCWHVVQRFMSSCGGSAYWEMSENFLSLPVWTWKQHWASSHCGIHVWISCSVFVETKSFVYFSDGADQQNAYLLKLATK